MSVEKFNPSISGQSIPYTMVCNKVIQNIDNMEAFAVWVYLLSLPKDWEVVKQHVKNHFNMGNKKLKSIFAYLVSHNLIKSIQSRDENGRMGKSEIQVLNGTEFIKNPNKINTATVGSENRPAVHRPIGKDTTTNKTNNKENKKQKENIKSEGKNPRATATISSIFVPDKSHELLAAQLHVDVAKEKDAFIDYYKARGKKMADWGAAFNSWLRKSAIFEKRHVKKEHPATEMLREVHRDFHKLNPEEQKSLIDFMN